MLPDRHRRRRGEYGERGRGEALDGQRYGPAALAAAVEADAPRVDARPGGQEAGDRGGVVGVNGQAGVARPFARVRARGGAVTTLVVSQDGEP